MEGRCSHDGEGACLGKGSGRGADHARVRLPVPLVVAHRVRRDEVELGVVDARHLHRLVHHVQVVVVEERRRGVVRPDRREHVLEELELLVVLHRARHALRRRVHARAVLIARRPIGQPQVHEVALARREVRRVLRPIVVGVVKIWDDRLNYVRPPASGQGAARLRLCRVRGAVDAQPKDDW